MTQKYQVKVSMKQAATVETGIVLKQGDFGMQIEIEVLDFDVTGTTPQIVFRKAMGAVESTTITVSGNKYTYTFKGTELDTPGKCFCDLKLKNSTTQRISTASFMFRVIADTMDGLEQEASSYSDTIEQLLADVVHLSETPGLVRNDGSIDTSIKSDVTNNTKQINNLNNSISQTINSLITSATPGGNISYYYPTKAGNIYKFKTLGTTGNISVYVSSDGLTNSLLIFQNLSVRNEFVYTPEADYDYFRIYRSNSSNDLQMYVTSGEIVDATKGSEYTGENQYNTLGEAIRNQFDFVGGIIDENSFELQSNMHHFSISTPITKESTDIAFSQINDFGMLSSIIMKGETNQSGGIPTPTSRLPITAGVSPDQSGKYLYNIKIFFKDGTNTEKIISLDEPLYEHDYIDVLQGKLYKNDYQKILDGTVVYTRQTYSTGSRFVISGEKAKTTTTGNCDGLKVDGAPLSNMATDLTITNYSGGSSIFLVFNEYTTADDLKTYFASNPMKYVYQKANTTIIDIDILKDLKNQVLNITRVVCSTGVKITYNAKNHDAGYVYVGRRVGYNTAGDYTSILKALKETPYETTIFVGRGTYNIVDEYTDFYGADFWDNYSGYGDGSDKFLRGLWIAFGRKIVFDPFAKVIYNYTGNNQAVKTYFAPFATGGDGSIDGLNLTFNSGCRYAVHDDFAESDGEFIYKNCIFNGQAQSDTIGAGCGQANRYIIENCIFIGSTSEDHDDISYHNTGWSTGKCQIIVKDCYCENGIHFKWYGTSTDITECIVTNCTARRVICTAHTATPHDTENMVLYAWNNITTE